jgi:hypothetical protein
MSSVSGHGGSDATTRLVSLYEGSRGDLFIVYGGVAFIVTERLQSSWFAADAAAVVDRGIPARGVPGCEPSDVAETAALVAVYNHEDGSVSEYAQPGAAAGEYLRPKKTRR